MFTVTVPSKPVVGIVARRQGSGTRYSAMIGNDEVDHFDDSKPPSYDGMLTYLKTIETSLIEKLKDMKNPEGIVRQLQISIQVKIRRKG